MAEPDWMIEADRTVETNDLPFHGAASPSSLAVERSWSVFGLCGQAEPANYYGALEAKAP
jgi:hypothetical protein